MNGPIICCPVVHSSIDPFVHPAIRSSTHPCIHSSSTLPCFHHPSIHPSVHPPTHVAMRPFICPVITLLSIYPFMRPSLIHPSVQRPSMHTSIPPYSCICHPFIHLFPKVLVRCQVLVAGLEAELSQAARDEASCRRPSLRSPAAAHEQKGVRRQMTRDLMHGFFSLAVRVRPETHSELSGSSPSESRSSATRLH